MYSTTVLARSRLRRKLGLRGQLLVAVFELALDGSVPPLGLAVGLLRSLARRFSSFFAALRSLRVSLRPLGFGEPARRRGRRGRCRPHPGTAAAARRRTLPRGMDERLDVETGVGGFLFREGHIERFPGGRSAALGDGSPAAGAEERIRAEARAALRADARLPVRR